MNGKELLIGLSYIDRKYIEESEKESPVEQAPVLEMKPQRRQIPGRRIWLIAAAVALTLLLLGCAAVVYSRIHMKVVQHHVPTTAADTVAAVGGPEQEALAVKNVLTDCYPQILPEAYQMEEGTQINHSTRSIGYRNEAGQSIAFQISIYEPVNITLAPPMEKITMTVSGWDAVMQIKEEGAQVLNWYNEAEGYYGNLYTEDMTVDLKALAESVDYGPALPLTFVCKEGEPWNTWYPQQLPEGYVCRSVAPFSDGTQVISYSNMEHGITYGVSLTRDFAAEATEPPYDPFTWEDLTVGGQPARMMTTPGQRMLYWQNKQEEFWAMLIVSDAAVDIAALAESVAPGEPLAVSSEYLGPDYTIALEQDESTYVGWEPVYPQWVPQGYERTFVSDPAYGQQTIWYENSAQEQIRYTFYFRLGQWSRQFDGMGQPEAVVINGNPGYRLSNSLIWTDEAKGFGFELVGMPGVDLMAVAESVALGPELEPTLADKTTKALAELGDYRITQLPKGMVEDSVTGIPLEDGGGWYAYVRRWYVNPNTNAQIYLEYEHYTADPPVPVNTLIKNYLGDRPTEFSTVNGCSGAVSQDGDDANVVWIIGNGKQGVRFKLISSDYTAQELLTMAESVQKK